MNKDKSFNTRILIGNELGENYFIIQELVNDKWHVYPQNCYQGNYFVRKKIKELLKYNIDSIQRSNKNDVIKLRLNNNINVYINNYSIIKNNPELKILRNIINKELIYKKFIKNFSLKKSKNISNDNSLKLVILSSISLGIIISSSNFDIHNNFRINTDDLLISNNSYYDNLHENFLFNYDYNYNKMKFSYHNHGEVSNEEVCDIDVIEEFSKMYFMDYNRVKQIYLNNYDEINNSENADLTLLLKVKNEFYNDDTIDKNPIITDKTSEEKEKYIIDIARRIYKVDSNEEFAILLAIHRLETSWGKSDKCVYDNNPGGLKEGDKFLEFKTFEIGAECFVRNVLKIERQAIQNYDNNLSLEENMQKIYCEGENDWAKEVTCIKQSLLSSNDFDNNIDSNLQKNTKKLHL